MAYRKDKQIIRAVDMVLFTGILLLAASQKGLAAELRVALIIIALATFAYNAEDYREEEKLRTL